MGWTLRFWRRRIPPSLTVIVPANISPTCEWPACQSPGTHTVHIHFADPADETWVVCRRHDRKLKLQAVRSRPRKPTVTDEPTPNVVHCGGCRRLLEERSDIAVDERSPCPGCGSSARNIEVRVSATLVLHVNLQTKVKRSGKGGWIMETRQGDDYTRDLGAWGTRKLTTDREKDFYGEVIELWDGTRIESTARLRDHHDRRPDRGAEGVSGMRRR